MNLPMNATPSRRKPSHLAANGKVEDAGERFIGEA